MNKKTLGILVACAGIALSSLTSVAQARDDHHGRHDKHGKHERRDHYRHHDRGFDRGYNRGYDRGYHDSRRYAPQVRHYGPPRWSRGDRLPRDYYGPRYVVSDWGSRRLHRPNPGYQWMQVGSEFLLVAIASGVIAQVIMSR